MKAVEPRTAKKIQATRDGLIVFFEDRQVTIAWPECSPKLRTATEAQRLAAELSPGGYGIHWPLLDEDLSINGLLRNS
jgi:hypothetical protein